MNSITILAQNGMECQGKDGKMSNLSLYNITNKFVEIMDKVQDGELTEEEHNELGEELAMQLQQKSGNIAGYIQERNSLLDAFDTQIKRLQDLKRIEQNKVDKFKEYVKENMERLGITKIETDLGTLSIAKSPVSVEITNENEIPAEYKLEVVTTKIDKKAIADNFKATGEIPNGVVIHADNTNLRVR